ncbi:hypothetical protein B9J78_00150 [bacterium Unc6]|nr:hypothetical protein [bacterium Unc6]
MFSLIGCFLSSEITITVQTKNRKIYPLKVEIADSPQKWQQGLIFRKSIQEGIPLFLRRVRGDYLFGFEICILATDYGSCLCLP